mmetsp:Transcript_139160/g.253207  ORF Transcript_139160/g.253207 Transcript_139160/m.253207 type:complete len:130 (+) Transcript_139160:86-475(+)
MATMCGGCCTGDHTETIDADLSSVVVENEKAQPGLAPASSQFEIYLEKSPGDIIGLDIDWGDRTTLKVLNVKPGGLIAKWNETNPDKELKKDDLIVDINGSSGNSKALMEVIRNNDKLAVKVLRRVALP